jgi:hypothetical protein
MGLWFSIPTFNFGIVILLIGRSLVYALSAPLLVLSEPLPVGPSPFHSVMLLRIIFLLLWPKTTYKLRHSHSGSAYARRFS